MAEPNTTPSPRAEPVPTKTVRGASPHTVGGEVMAKRRLGARLKAYITVASLISAIVTAGFFVWDRLRSREMKLFLEPVVFRQTPFTIDEDATGRKEVHWEGCFALTNLSAERIAITDIEPLFDLVRFEDAGWRLERRVPISPPLLSGRVFDTELDLMTVDEDKSEDNRTKQYFQYRRSAPFVLEPGQKQLFLLDYEFIVMKSDTPVLVSDSDELRNLVAVLSGGYVDEDGRCGGVFAPLSIRVTDSEARKFTARIKTLLVVAGCYLKRPGCQEKEDCG